MENEEKLNIATKSKLATTQVTTSLAVDVDDGKITKVLTLCARPKITSIQTDNGQVKFDGNVIYDMLVVTSDSQILPLSKEAPFSQVVENAGVSIGDNITILPEVQEVSSEFRGEELFVSSTANFALYIVKQNEQISLCGNLDDVFTKTEEQSYTALVRSISSEFSLPLSFAKDGKIGSILCLKNMASIKSILPSSDYFAVSGEVYTTIVYMSQDGTVRSTFKETPFSEEVEAQGTTKDSIVQALLSVPSYAVQEGDNAFDITLNLSLEANVYEPKTFECVLDAYSLKNDVNLTTSSFAQNTFLSTIQVEDNLLTNFALEEGMAPIDKILATVPTNVTITSQIVKNGEILLEGIATINMIYYSEDEDGNKILSSIDIDVPYSVPFVASELKEQDLVTAQIDIGDINIKSRHGRELEILIELYATLNISRDIVGVATTELTLGEIKPAKDCALEIYLVREGDTLWDIAKKLNISMSELSSQNPQLSLELKPGDKVVAYTREESN